MPISFPFMRFIGVVCSALRGLGTGGGQTKSAGWEGPQSLPWVCLTKLPLPEIEPVSNGSRFSAVPQPVKRGIVAFP